MKLETIAVGNEIITGNTINTNASYLARQVQKIGIWPTYHSAVGDDKIAIQEALQIACNRADIICLIGGLGPTPDDLTKETVGDFFGVTWEEREEAVLNLKTYFKRLDKEMPSCNLKQAQFPVGSVMLNNPFGTAPGCILKEKNKHIILLPGPPRECHPMVDNEMIPYLKTLVHGIYSSEDIQLMGIGESHLMELAGDLIGEFENLTVAPYIGNYRVHVRMTAQGENEIEVKNKINHHKKLLAERLEEYIVGYNEDTIEDNILKLLEKNQFTIATAESCTGGLLAGTLINACGISKYLNESYITYSNDAKIKCLGVKEETLLHYGAVSSQTASEMAVGVQKVAGSSIGLATTGIAGPDGGTPTKPVGLVYIGIAIGKDVYTYELHLTGTRQTIRERSVYRALYHLYCLLK